MGSGIGQGDLPTSEGRHDKRARSFHRPRNIKVEDLGGDRRRRAQWRGAVSGRHLLGTIFGSSNGQEAGKRGTKLYFCYEAGPTGYGLYRQIVELDHECSVVAPSLVPKRAGDRVKTNRRDAISLARLHRAGELTPVWVPDEAHEAVRDLVRARDAAFEAQKQARQQLNSFLLRHGDIIEDRKPGPARMESGWHLKRSIIPRIKFCSPNIVRLLRTPAFVLID